MIPIAAPIIEEEERAAVLEVLASGQLAQGQKVQEFEERFAAWCGARYAVAMSSGTSALHAALLAHGIGPGDEVLTSPFSFVASANCALYVGARPVFVDIEPEYFTIDPDELARRVTERTRAVVCVHLFGQACDMAPIAAFAAAHGLILIEDACQAHGAKYRDRAVGSFGTACYSFYPTKNMMTGEGGMLTTNDAAVAERVRLIREHGSHERYRHEMLGYNLRMTELQAAIGLAQLPKVDAWNAQRQANAAYLTEKLAALTGVVPPRVRKGSTHVFHQYTVRLCERDSVVKELKTRGVGVGIYYPLPIHQQPLYRHLGYEDHLPEAEAASREVLSLPIHPRVTAADLDHIADAVRGS